MKDSLFQDFACDWSCGKGHQKISVSAQIEVTGKILVCKDKRRLFVLN